MKIEFVAGFGPIVPDKDAARAFWEGGLGIELEEAAPDYLATDDLPGVRAFALWRLEDAAQSCFGEPEWPAGMVAPQAWIEFDVASREAVAEAADELTAAGHRLVRPAQDEEWGQTVARLMSPEGLLVGISYTPWMHEAPKPEDITES